MSAEAASGFSVGDSSTGFDDPDPRLFTLALSGEGKLTKRAVATAPIVYQVSDPVHTCTLSAGVGAQLERHRCSAGLAQKVRVAPPGVLHACPRRGILCCLEAQSAGNAPLCSLARTG